MSNLIKHFFFSEPLPPINLQVKEASPYNLYIEWEAAPTSIQDYYRVFITGDTNASEVFDSPNLTDLSYNVTALTPGHFYTITVLSSSQTKLSNFTSVVQDNTGMHDSVS